MHLLIVNKKRVILRVCYEVTIKLFYAGKGFVNNSNLAIETSTGK
jgi:hypothetical protein